MSTNSNVDCKEYWKQLSVQYARTTFILCSFLAAIFTSSIVSAHSSTNLSTNFFLHLQFL